MIIFTSESYTLQDQMNLVWEYLLPAIIKEALSENLEAENHFDSLLQNLSNPTPEKTSQEITLFSEMKIILEPKELNFNYVDLRFSNSDITLTTQLADSSFLVDFDHGEWRLSETERAGPNIFGVKGSMSHLDPFKTATSYKWTAKNTLELSIRYVESPHKELK